METQPPVPSHDSTDDLTRGAPAAEPARSSPHGPRVSRSFLDMVFAVVCGTTVMVVLYCWIPIFGGHLIGGYVAGRIARGFWRGLIAGALSGVAMANLMCFGLPPGGLVAASRMQTSLELYLGCCAMVSSVGAIGGLLGALFPGKPKRRA